MGDGGQGHRDDTKRAQQDGMDLRLNHQEKIMSLVLDTVNLSFRLPSEVELFIWAQEGG